MPKKLISAMLMLALLCSSLAIPQDFHLTASADDTTYWNNNASTEEPSKEDPTGAGANVYLIDSAEELAWVAKQVNGGNNFSGETIKLTDDIDLAKNASGEDVRHQWVPIGLGDDKPFKGNFDGCGYTISNMHIGGNPSEGGTAASYNYAGLFGYVKADNNQTVTIQNVNIGTGSWVYTSGQFAGGICAYAYANAALTISNCCNSANIKVDSSSFSYAGGICAYASASAPIIISNCCNSNNISSSNNKSDINDNSAGGICACVQSYGTAVTINNCINSGAVNVSETRSGSVSGICTIAQAWEKDSTINISNCCSKNGELEVSSKSKSDKDDATAYAGGICSYAYTKDSNSKITITNCCNNSELSAKTTDNLGKKVTAYAGGICSNVNCSADNSVLINNCYNSATTEASLVVDKRREDSVCFAGGICARIFGDGNPDLTNTYYKSDDRNSNQLGIGNKKKDEQTGTTALPENQMTAATSSKPSEGDTWTSIEVTGMEDTTEKTVPLVDALNAGVKAYNNNNNNKPAVEALYWEVKEAGKYPTFLNTWSAKVKLDSEFYCYADFSPFAAGNNKGKSYDAPYEIKNAAQLAALAILVNNAGTGSVSVKDINNNSATCSDFQDTYIKLTASFSLGAHEWVPIGLGDSNPFKGNFDGDNKIISNMHIGTSGAYASYNCAGLFGRVQADNNQTVTIQNVNIGTGSWVYTSGLYAGGICAKAYAAYANATITISNCSNSGHVSSYSDPDYYYYYYYAGGICAYAYTNATITISNCCNSGSVKATSTRGTVYAGGICAYAEASATITISNCCNSANITADSDYYSHAGGICAKAYADDANATITISNCCNSANITADSYYSDAGGICALAHIYVYVYVYANATIIISNCCNSANITAITAGGICANADDANATITISNCSNSANITAITAGGICAYAEAYADADDANATITISNCSNSANITADSYYFSYAGGICAKADDANATITISNCYYLDGCVGKTDENGIFKSSSLQLGIGNKGKDEQTGTPALPEDQMKAATGSSAPSGDNTWKSITVTGTGITDKAVPLVDALNAWVNNYNNNTEKDAQGYIEALPWVINETSGYPEINYTVPNLSFQTELGHDIYALPIKSVDTDNITVPTLNILSNPQGNKIENVYWFLDGSYYSASGTGTDSGIEELKEAIRVKIAKDKSSPITVKAVYQDEDYNIVKGSGDDNKYILEVVEYNKLSVGAYAYDTDVIVPDASSKNNKGKDFLYWEGNADNDLELEILSYASSYTFHLKTDRTIIAVYGDRAGNAPVATTNIESISEILFEGVTALRVVSTGSVADGYKIDYAGLIITNDGNLAENPDDFKINNNFEVSYSGSDGKKYKVCKSEYESPGQNIFYSLRLKVSNMEEPLYVRAFIRYKNDTNLQNVEYSEIFKIEFAGDTMTWTSLSTEGGSN